MDGLISELRTPDSHTQCVKSRCTLKMESFGNFVTLCFYFEYLSIHILSSETKTPLWTWQCVNEKCLPDRAMEGGPLQSLETCNMLCTTIQLWPQPTGPASLATAAVATGADLFQLHKLEAPSKIVKEHVIDLFELFKADLRVMGHNFTEFGERHNVLVNIYIHKSGDPRMRQDTDESYRLVLKPELTGLTLSANITANSFCGARHAFETLTQLVWLDPLAEHLMILQGASISDAPKFRYRGLMVDTAGSYLPMSALLRTIDAMAISKLNTLHWHVSDSRAFSLQLCSVPQLAMYGAYSQNDVYHPEQVRVIARRARLRGIRIIIEIDTPSQVGHAWRWGPTLQLGELMHCIEPEPSWQEYCSTPPCGHLNPFNNHVFNILARVYSEIIQLTAVDDIFHLGGSEISESCWRKYYASSDPTELWIQFTKSALRSLESVTGKLPNLTLFWTSGLTKHMKKDFNDYIHAIGLQMRSSSKIVKEQYISGIRTVLSDEDPWDLNSGLGEWYEQNGGAMFNSWQRVYDHRPWVRLNLGVVEGGEATVWSRNLNPGDLDGRIWPRAAALGERLWTDRPEGPTRSVTARLDFHRSRMLSRGFKAAPIWSYWCTQNTYTCY